MELFDAFVKKLPQNFNVYVNSLSADSRKAMMNSLSRYGDPERILEDLLCTPSCCLNRELDVRISDEFVLEFTKKKRYNYPQVYLHKIDTIRYCYHSRGGMCTGYDVVGIIKTNGSTFEFMVAKSKLDESAAIFHELQQRVHGFEHIPYEPVSEENGQMNSNYLDDIIWCEQYHDSDGDADSSYWLKLYRCNKKKETRIFDSEEDAFRAAIKLKKHIPHLLYGPSEEYQRIYKKDPAELMALAKSKIRK